MKVSKEIVNNFVIPAMIGMVLGLILSFLLIGSCHAQETYSDINRIALYWDESAPSDSIEFYYVRVNDTTYPIPAGNDSIVFPGQPPNDLAIIIQAANKCARMSDPSEPWFLTYAPPTPPAPADLDSVFYDLNAMSVIWEANGITGTYSGNRIGLWNGMGIIFSAPQKDDYWITVTVAGKTGPAMIRINGIEKTVGTISEDVTIKLVGVSGIRIEAVGDLLFFKGIYLMRQLFDCPKPKRVIIRAVTIK